MIYVLLSEWDRFAKGEYERLAMEEEGGDDSEMIDAMDGWDSEDDSTAQTNDTNTNNGNAATTNAGGSSSPGEENKKVDEWKGLNSAKLQSNLTFL